MRYFWKEYDSLVTIKQWFYTESITSHFCAGPKRI